MSELKQTIFHPRHAALGAKLVPFAGWTMPVHYDAGIVTEHLNARRRSGLFDVSHMGRFLVQGRDALPFLQHVLTNNAAALEVGQSQYTLVPNKAGGALDDAFLYRFVADAYLLVVNAANRDGDWAHLQSESRAFKDVVLVDQSEALAMLALQGPESKAILTKAFGTGCLPEPIRNYLSVAEVSCEEMGKAPVKLLVARTGYTGEPLCFELFVDVSHGLALWDRLMACGALPAGLGARDTLRLEAGLPLYGHELGQDPEGREIPILACPLSAIATSFSPLKGEFIGRESLRAQFEAHNRYKLGDFSTTRTLPRRIMPLAVSGKGIARAGSRVFLGDRLVGHVTSGTMVPYWRWDGVGLDGAMTDEHGMRSICLALLDSELPDRTRLSIAVRNRRIDAVIVPYHMRSEAPPFARAILYDHVFQPAGPAAVNEQVAGKALNLIRESLANSQWRQADTINLIPSEQTGSAMVRLLSIMDPCSRYAEHKAMKAFEEADIFYYQGTKFIAQVEQRLEAELRLYLDCPEVETRTVSGQMANAAFFSAMVDYLNCGDRKREQRRIRQVLNHHIVKGGHLSAQPMGALRDFVRRDPAWERPAVVNFPMQADNPFDVDVAAACELIDTYRPELIIFGRSMTICREPVAPIRTFIREIGLDCVVMYDMAHVFGLVGPYFQMPFREGADIVTASTHKTYFGTQRGIIASRFQRDDVRYPLWEAVRRRVFPGSVSNHHLGTQLGLLMAAYEMNCFRDAYQRQVLANAKAFACALSASGLTVAGDPARSFTDTHQVIVSVGFCRGPEMAERLEASNIIVNFQAGPEEESFSAAGYIRLGVSEMTRFGMKERDFEALAELMAQVILRDKDVKDQAAAMRKRFLELEYCFSGDGFANALQDLHRAVLYGAT